MPPDSCNSPYHPPPLSPEQRLASSVPLPPSTRPSSPSPTSTFDQQLNEVRQSLADRVKQQQQEDPDFPITSPEQGVGTEETSGAGEAEGGTLRQRRASAVSAASEDEDELVERLLRPGKLRTAEPVVETVREEPIVAEDAPTCRICFDGADEDSKLFSPCLCKGTASYVHRQCLESWRKASQNRSSFYACETCGYRYKFRRTAVARVVTSKVTVTVLTSSLFFLLVFLAGFLANTLISLAESRPSRTFFDDFFVADHILLGEGVREAVSFVSHQLEDSRFITGSTTSDNELEKEEDDDSTDTTFYRYINPSAAKRVRRKDRPRSSPFLLRAVMHLVKGSSLIGILSVFYTYVAATFVSPLGRGLLRAIRPGAVGGRRRNDTGASISQVVIIALVVLGLVRSVRSVYRGVRWGTKQVLSRVEDLVLDVNS